MSRVAGFLDLGNLGLREVPDELFAFDHLTSLNLGALTCASAQVREVSK